MSEELRAKIVKLLLMLGFEVEQDEESITARDLPELIYIEPSEDRALMFVLDGADFVEQREGELTLEQLLKHLSERASE